MVDIHTKLYYINSTEKVEYMVFTKRCTYGIRALLELVPHYPDQWVAIKTISKETGIPRKYLDQVLLQLKHAGILKSKMGSEGGYALNRAPNEIRTDEIMVALRGTTALAECSKKNNVCRRKPNCRLNIFICEAEEKFNAFLKATRLSDIYEKQIQDVNNYAI